jgi:hypothetical protein
VNQSHTKNILRVLALVGIVALSACGSSSTSPKTTSVPTTTVPSFTTEHGPTGDYIVHLKPGVTADEVCSPTAKPKLHAEFLHQLAALGLAHGSGSIVEFMDGYPAPGTAVNTTLCGVQMP